MERRLRRVFDCLVVACISCTGLLLLPLLLLSLRARQWFFVRIMAVAGRLWRDYFQDTRRETIAALDEIESSDPELRADGAIRVLEVGAGSGANLGFMRRKIKYWNVDPNTEFQNFFLETVKKYPKGGRLVFMEHVAQPKGSVGRILQNVLTPLWCIICCGCCLNRDSGDVIKKAGFAEVHLNETNVDMPVILTRHVYGYAVA
ncbi:putative methyltransferase-like protein 7A isoform X2 [Dermacentor silvarum]|uniref:putative methyltransferase-like protein 7A isoform X2 n=1 Tax=Dermacentor silvarum TaxID=543639 RepID=UPI002101BBC8|nr:putative methyltransferase-like protein 7A isoform X2 [Dermacentor silvarum]